MVAAFVGASKELGFSVADGNLYYSSIFDGEVFQNHYDARADVITFRRFLRLLHILQSKNTCHCQCSALLFAVMCLLLFGAECTYFQAQINRIFHVNTICLLSYFFLKNQFSWHFKIWCSIQVNNFSILEILPFNYLKRTQRCSYNSLWISHCWPFSKDPQWVTREAKMKHSWEPGKRNWTYICIADNHISPNSSVLINYTISARNPKWPHSEMTTAYATSVNIQNNENGIENTSDTISSLTKHRPERLSAQTWFSSSLQFPTALSH